MSKKTKWTITGIVGFIASVIGIFVFVTGKNLPDFFHAKPANASATTVSTTNENVTLGKVAVGDIVHFGSWDWRVLEVKGGRALLITRDIIEYRAYNDEWKEVTWETCTLRAYLNGEFLENFSTQDQAKILETRNANTDNQWFGTSGGSDTTDKAFLLSIEDMVRYFDLDKERVEKGPRVETEEGPEDIYWISDKYNDRRVANFNNKTSQWCLRSPGSSQVNTATVDTYGIVDLVGGGVSFERGTRPALWLKID